MESRHEALMAAYPGVKDPARRREILRQLLCDMPADAKDFFLQAFKKERYLDMKLFAVRGYAAYATEAEVAPLMKKLTELLLRRAEKTPYNYTEYEPMRSVFLMPYLCSRYGYACFNAFRAQLETLYHAMPDCFKDVFTLDENGVVREIRDPKEVSRSWEAFWAE